QDGQKRIIQGSKPADGARLKRQGGGYESFSNLIMDASDRNKLVQMHPTLNPVIRPYVGGDELISGEWRFCLWLKDASPKDYDFPEIRDRLRRVKSGRLQSPTLSVQQYADYPTLFTQDRQPQVPYIAIPEVSSETRDYIPIALLGPEVIASNKLMIMPGGTIADFAILTSRMHMAWMRTVAGRLKSDYSYSPSVYNTFPLPPAKDLSKLDLLAQAVLDARAAHPGATLATLYDPDLMPPNLRAAHTALDRAVDRFYRPAGFASDRERVEHLFALYEAMVAPLLAAPKQRRGRAKS
ncbi:type IIL restriction-modification enzyme MmeI, partial [Tabrizicola sp.]|uniref:type IIL restriction-modification enzyme MmeI n=1 Tax=Tabrizicola sp. TaxID=2005166 RepID=UPI00386F52C1